MQQSNLKILDCTLRDGGYVNDWKWGYLEAREIVRLLTKATVDIIEVGFLKNVEAYNPDVTVCNTIEELNRLLPEKTGNIEYSAMAMQSNYDIDKLSDYSGQGIGIIRVTAHDYDIEEGLIFASKVKEKGYKVSINPINIMGYSDEQILEIIKKVNHIDPYQFSIVDTFGSMKRRDLDRIVSIVDRNLNENIRLALHLHENMSLGCCLAQQFIDKHLNRPISVDGSLMGMGRVPGNLPIELIADYCNEYVDKSYDIDYLLDAIQDYIKKYKGESKWGYTPAYFLSGRFNVHRNYAEYYLEKGDLTNRDIDNLLSKIHINKSTVFDKEYADELYSQYQNKIIDDKEDIERLKLELQGKNVLIIAPGMSISKNKDSINEYIQHHDCKIISTNFVPNDYRIDYAFFSNNRRYSQNVNRKGKFIILSNIHSKKAEFRLNYNSLTGTMKEAPNSFLMLLKLLKRLDIDEVNVVGADGFDSNTEDYYISTITSPLQRTYEYNMFIRQAIKKINIKVNFITSSIYDDNEE